MKSLLRQVRRYSILAVLVLPIAAGAFVWQHPAIWTAAAVFEQVFEAMSVQYVDTLPKDSLYIRAARGLLREFHDPYTELYAPAEAAKLQNSLQGNITGIGVSIGVDSNGAYLKTILPGAPAALAGLHIGDRLLQVDTMQFRPGVTLAQAVGHISGPIGTTVHLTIVREQLGRAHFDTLQPAIVRARIHSPAVPFTLLLDKQVGYIPLRQFSSGIATDVRNALDTLRKQGATKFILDLRGNPGGLTDEAISLCGLFLSPEQVVVRMRDRSGEREYRTSASLPMLPTQPLVVLVDPYTASAAELTSGALQDHDRAAVIGQSTYGKGVAQSIRQMPDGYVIKLTTQRWYTPLGRSIQRERKLLPTGEYAAVHPESLETAAERRARPTYKSENGRTLYGGGGVVPDLYVRDTLGVPGSRFFSALASDTNRWRLQSLLSSYVASLPQTALVPVTPVVRAAFLEQLRVAGIVLPKTVVATELPFLNRLIAERLMLMRGDLAAAAQVRMVDDRSLTNALTVLRQSTDQASVFATLH